MFYGPLIFGDTYMNYALVSKLIFQNFITTGVNVINSTPMLKALIIAYLTENSISYVDTDIDALTLEVMRFLSVEEVVAVPVASVEEAIGQKSLTPTEIKKLNSFIADMKFKIKELQLFKDTKLTKESKAIINGDWEEYDEKSLSLIQKTSDYADFLDNLVEDIKCLEA